MWLSIGEFAARLEEPGPADQWLLRPLVDALVAAGQVPGPDQRDRYRMLPVFGGEYAPDNVVLRDLATHYAAFGPSTNASRTSPTGRR